MPIHRRGQALAAVAALAFTLAPAMPFVAFAKPIADQPVDGASPHTFDIFLDRLMTAESAGRTHAKNPRSTALGPFQFIKTTFLDVARRHFHAEIGELPEREILRLRTDRTLSRRAAAVYCKETASNLKEQGLEPTFAHLRLAFLLGPADAARILKAEPHAAVTQLLRPAVIRANPFMRGMRVSDLLAKSEREVNRDSNKLVVDRPQPHVRPSAHSHDIDGNKKDDPSSMEAALN